MIPKYYTLSAQAFFDKLSCGVPEALSVAAHVLRCEACDTIGGQLVAFKKGGKVALLFDMIVYEDGARISLQYVANEKDGKVCVRPQAPVDQLCLIDSISVCTDCK